MGPDQGQKMDLGQEYDQGLALGLIWAPVCVWSRTRGVDEDSRIQGQIESLGLWERLGLGDLLGQGRGQNQS